ncbi:KRAB-A domain-containing protein 2-like [Melanaphis sacchari]|nr:KRAB-A domain-containing protein 2-like [Melanaphis sacchari]
MAIANEENYKKIINEVLEAKHRKNKTSLDYRRLNRYDIIKVGEINKLIFPLHKSENNEVKYYLHNDEIYDVLEKSHKETGHGGLHKMIYHLKNGYVNISRPVIQLYLNNCVTCLKKRVSKKRGVVVKPMVFNEVNARGQVDLIDMQSCHDGGYKFILNYQDHLSKFVILRALKTKTAAEVTYHLIDIFCTFGAPSILQSDNGREFVNCIIDELKNMWPQLKIIHGKPCHSQSQGSVERANRDVQDILRAWMSDNKSNKWSEGLRFCQFQKNSSYHSGIKQSPFEVLFGRKAQLGLTSSALSENILKTLNSENDLEQAISSLELINYELNKREVSEDNILEQALTESEDNILEQVSTVNESVLEEITIVQGKINKNKKLAVSSLHHQAKRMKIDSILKYPIVSIGTNVTLPVLDVDGSKEDSRNIIGVIIEITTDDLYKIGTKNGIIAQLTIQS